MKWTEKWTAAGCASHCKCHNLPCLFSNSHHEPRAKIWIQHSEFVADWGDVSVCRNMLVAWIFYMIDPYQSDTKIQNLPFVSKTTQNIFKCGATGQSSSRTWTYLQISLQFWMRRAIDKMMLICTKTFLSLFPLYISMYWMVLYSPHRNASNKGYATMTA